MKTVEDILQPTCKRCGETIPQSYETEEIGKNLCDCIEITPTKQD